MIGTIQQGREFLDFVATHEVELKRLISKEIPHKGDIFDEVYQEAVLKVYGAITRGA